MASFKLYLDTRAPRKDGTFPLKIAVHHRGRFLINLKVYTTPENLVGDEVIIPGAPARQKNTNTYISNRLVYVENTLNKLVLLGQLADLSDARLKRLLDTNNPVAEDRPPLLRDHFVRFIDKKSTPGTKGVYQHTLNRIGQFCNLDILTFKDITVPWLDAFDAELAKTCGVNARAIHMRNIRAVINDAIRDEVIDQNHYPFRKWTIRHEKTRKRSLSVQQLRTLRDYECEAFMQQYRDMFMLIFYFIGINAVDLFKLTEIKDGRIEFRRSKTGRLYSIKVEPEALAIIKRYRGEHYLLNVRERYGNYQNYLSRLNDNLQRLGPVTYVANNTKPKGNRTKNGPDKKQYSPLFPGLSTYWARHSWATVAASLNIPKETIAAALGHGGNTVTDIYIDFDQRKIDKANRKVIDHVNGTKPKGK